MRKVFVFGNGQLPRKEKHSKQAGNYKDWFILYAFHKKCNTTIRGEHMESIWNGIEKQEFLQQQEEIKTDVLIIGGGMSGLLCAYMLQKEGVDCVLVEADKLCAGVTNGTTAKITAQHGLIYDKISKNYGDEKAKQYYKSQKEAMDIYRTLKTRLLSELGVLPGEETS